MSADYSVEQYLRWYVEEYVVLLEEKRLERLDEETRVILHPLPETRR